MSKKLLQKFDERLRSALLREYDRQNVRATGKSIASLVSDISDTRYKLTGSASWQWLDRGRGKTVQAGDRRKRIANLYEWVGIRKYGINYENDKQRLSIAYAIAAKQDKEGSYKFRNPSSRTDVVRASIAEALPLLRTALGRDAAKNIRSDIKQAYGDTD